jgi:hypothetical protein
MNDFPILRYFQYTHLPVHLLQISQPFCNLAEEIVKDFQDAPNSFDVEEVEAGLRKLLEAKDCIVRSGL